MNVDEDVNIEALLGLLNERDRDIVESRLIDNNNYADIARKHCISSKRVADIINVSMKRMRHHIWKKRKGWEEMVLLAGKAGLLTTKK